ncbi:hypothetical protein D3C72_315740 [compost metagenome]
MTSSDPFLPTPAAAAFLGVHRSFLDRRRVEGGGPAFIRLSARKIVYAQSVLDAWVAARRRLTTSDTGPAA